MRDCFKNDVLSKTVKLEKSSKLELEKPLDSASIVSLCDF